MSSPTKCANCPKTTNLKHCAKCKSEQYCSRDCQKAHWKLHKKMCALSSAPPPGTLKGLTSPVVAPFTKLHHRQWLHDRAEQDVYKLLVDCFRLRMEDEHTFEGKINQADVRGGAPSSLHAFEKFLTMAEKANGILPPWWSDFKRAECIDVGNKDDSWLSLKKQIKKADVIEHYGAADMPMQLRLFGEQIYGRGVGGQSGEGLIAMQMKQEEGRGYKHVKMVDVSGRG